MYTAIKTFADACKSLNLDPSKVIPDMAGFPVKHITAMESHAKLVIVAEAVNGNWTPDWNDEDQPKYFPWFDMENGFCLHYVDGYYSDSYVSSRLCFESREKARHVLDQPEFLQLYKNYFTYE